MRADNIPIIKLLELPVSCDMFDRDSMASTFPTLFAENESAVMEALQENVGLVHSDLQKLARRFFCPEYVHPKEAATIVACPREGMGVCRFRRPKFQPRPSYQQQQANTHHQDKKQKTSHVAGRIDPHPDLTLAKYSTETTHLTNLLPHHHHSFINVLSLWNLCSRGVSPELVRGQRCPLRHCQRWNKKLAHFAVIVKS
jgi:hypothetical protein